MLATFYYSITCNTGLQSKAYVESVKFFKNCFLCFLVLKIDNRDTQLSSINVKRRNHYMVTTKIVGDVLGYNRGALATVWSQLSGATMPSSQRYDLVWAYVSIAIKHHEGIYILVDQNIMAPAFALLRSQIETFYRGLWVNLIATDEQVIAIRDRDEEPFPRFRQMATDLDAAYGAGGWLKGFADRWAALNSYTHSGLLQLGQQFRADGTVGPNYSDAAIVELLVISGTTSIGCIVPLFRHVQFNDKAAALEQWLVEHPVYRRDGTSTT